MTKELLQKNLFDLKIFMNSLKAYDTEGLLFFNLESFYSFIEKTLKLGNTFRSAVENVKPYIPITVSDESLHIFLDAALQNDEKLVVEMEAVFLENSTSRFINSVYNADNEESWHEIMNVCENIFDYKQNGVL